MISSAILAKNTIISVVAMVAFLLVAWSSHADPSKYPEFAQQTVPKDVKLAFISVEEMATEIQKGAKPLIIDVRSAEEFREAHILGAVSAPLTEFRAYLKSIPRDRMTILY